MTSGLYVGEERIGLNRWRLTPSLHCMSTTSQLRAHVFLLRTQADGRATTLNFSRQKERELWISHLSNYLFQAGSDTTRDTITCFKLVAWTTPRPGSTISVLWQRKKHSFSCCLKTSSIWGPHSILHKGINPVRTMEHKIKRHERWKNSWQADPHQKKWWRNFFKQKENDTTRNNDGLHTQE